MQRILRHLAPLALLIAALALVACGGGDEGGSTGGTAVEGEDPQAILDQTFSNEGDKKVDSGKIELTMNLEASGEGTEQLGGPVNVTLSGPFQSQGEKEVPLLDLDLSFQGAGQDIQAGVTSTGDKGFVNFNGQEYAVSEEVFSQFKAGFEQAQEQQTDETTLEQLGIAPNTWLTNATNEGDSTVGDTETVKITGDVDLEAMLNDVNKILSQAGSLGVPQTGQIPTKLTPEQIAQVQEAVNEASVEIETGKEDSILRRMAFTLAAEDPEGSGGTINVDFDLSLTDLNEDQEISEPEDTKPFDELLGQFGGLGGLGALGGASGSSGGASSDATAEYAQCVADAGSDTAAAQECSALLAP